MITMIMTMIMKTISINDNDDASNKDDNDKDDGNDNGTITKTTINVMFEHNTNEKQDKTTLLNQGCYQTPLSSIYQPILNLITVNTKIHEDFNHQYTRISQHWGFVFILR